MKTLEKWARADWEYDLREAIRKELMTRAMLSEDTDNVQA